MTDEPFEEAVARLKKINPEGNYYKAHYTNEVFETDKDFEEWKQMIEEAQAAKDALGPDATVSELLQYIYGTKAERSRQLAQRCKFKSL